MAKKPPQKPLATDRSANAADPDGPFTSYPTLFLTLYERAAAKFRTKDELRAFIGEHSRVKVSLNWRTDHTFAPRADPKQLDALCTVANATPEEREELLLSWLLESGAKSKTKAFLEIGLRSTWERDRADALRLARDLYRATAAKAEWPIL